MRAAGRPLAILRSNRPSTMQWCSSATRIGRTVHALAPRPPLNGLPLLTRLQLRCSAASRVLLDAVHQLADVQSKVLGPKVARLDLSGETPQVWIDPHAEDADLAPVLAEILSAIVIGSYAAPSADPVARLRAV